MLVIAGHWDFSWSSPYEEMHYWEGVIREYGVDEFWMCPRTGVKSKYLMEADALEDVLNHHKDLPAIYLAEDGQHALSSFEHPHDAMYILGRTNYSPFNYAASRGGVSVKIETPEELGMLMAPVAASIVLHDRYRKWQLQ